MEDQNRRSYKKFNYLKVTVIEQKYLNVAKLAVVYNCNANFIFWSTQYFSN